MTPALKCRRSFMDVAITAVALFFCIGTLIAQLSSRSRSLPHVHEEFDPTVSPITSIDAATAYVARSSKGRDPASLANAADEFVRRRFFHSYSFFDPEQNWLAYLAGFVWLDLRSPVLPNDILKHRRAACSQQVIVFDAIARRLGLQTAVVRFDGHMTAAVKVGSEWRVYDADREIEPRSYPLARLLAGDPAVLAIYRDAPGLVDLPGQVAHGRVRMTDVDSNPALHASLFDEATKALSHYGWALFVALAALRLVTCRRFRSWRFEPTEARS